MASFAPAACNLCAIAHAMLRLLATPNTTAVRPCIAFDILTVLAELKSISNASASHLGSFGRLLACRCNRRLVALGQHWFFNRPDRGYKRRCEYRRYHGKRGRQ